MNPEDMQAIWLTARLAFLTTALLLVFCTPLAWWLARGGGWLRSVVQALVAMPLILPPTVLGFYLLLLLSPRGVVGGFVESLGGPRLVFSFPGLLIGSFVYSLPFAVQPLCNAFQSLGRGPLEAAATLRAGALDSFFSVALPLAKPAFLTAATLSFAHTVGEFGVVLMIGGNIPGATQVLSIAIYNDVEALRYGEAHWLAGGMLVFSFAALALAHFFSRNRQAVGA